MRNLEKELENRTIDYNKLLEYGFSKEKNQYILKKNILNNQFEIIVNISEEAKTSKLIDLTNDEEYILVDIEDSNGEFVGRVREEYQNILQDVITNCTTLNIFKSSQANEVIKYVKEKYNDDLEFLWEKFDNNAIWRNKGNNKWYGLIVKVSERKLGIASDKIIEAIDLRYQKEDIENLVDGVKVYPGYHMNKKSWITIKLDNSMETKEIFELIDNSYNLTTTNNKCGLEGNMLAQKVYDYLTTIPKGKVVTYKQVAEHIGNKGLARVVGNILHKNPDENKYPCYKVLNSKGELAEAFVFGGANIQKKRLEGEGIEVIDNKVDLEIYQWKESIDNM